VPVGAVDGGQARAYHVRAARRVARSPRCLPLPGSRRSVRALTDGRHDGPYPVVLTRSLARSLQMGRRLDRLSCRLHRAGGGLTLINRVRLL
jgi:hypothetical protein